MSSPQNNKQALPFGSWPSKITADLVAGNSPRLSEPKLSQGRCFWLQSLPEEKGRVAILMKHKNSEHAYDWILPRPLSAKSKVHEYGGGSYCVDGDDLYFVLADDQRVYHARLDKDNFEPHALTPDSDAKLRFADLELDKHGKQLIAVCEDHRKTDEEAISSLVSIPLNGCGQLLTIAEGDDFYSSPAISPNKQYCCWLSWNHPHMPWDANLLWLCPRSPDGKFYQSNAKVVTGTGESIFQPRFSPDGDLFFVTDRDNWWNIYRIETAQFDKDKAEAQQVTQLEAEFATPQWTFNMSTYDFLTADTLLATYTQNGVWYLCKVQLDTGHQEAIEGKRPAIHGINCENNMAVYIASDYDKRSAVNLFDDANISSLTANNTPVHQNELSHPVAFTFQTGDQGLNTAHGFYYPPANAKYTATQNKPPMITICHGGPTGATEASLNFKIQYWTNRGFAVLDVNYRGSTGFGRSYRHSLHGQWGIYDVDDVCAAADCAVNQGWADPEKLIIKGSSAGGYTVLAALAFRNTFKAGVSLYGIGDLETLVTDTHKFEARYLDKLVGNYPQQKAIYEQRSPIHYIDDISCPLLVFQGLEDKVVPPNQAETMVDAVRAKGLEVRYITFPDEGHGFRNAHNIETMLNEELRFYQDIFEL